MIICYTQLKTKFQWYYLNWSSINTQEWGSTISYDYEWLCTERLHTIRYKYSNQLKNSGWRIQSMNATIEPKFRSRCSSVLSLHSLILRSLSSHVSLCDLLKSLYQGLYASQQWQDACLRLNGRCLFTVTFSRDSSTSPKRSLLFVFRSIFCIPFVFKSICECTWQLPMSLSFSDIPLLRSVISSESIGET